MKNLSVAVLVAGSMAFVAVGVSHAQAPATPTAKPAPIIITNGPANARGTKPYLSAGVQEVLKMHEAGVDKGVILAFVQSSAVAYHPSAKEVIYLRDEGISTEIISAMLKRGGELRDRAADLQREELRTRPIEQPAPAAPPPAQPAQPPSAAAAPQATQVVYAETPSYSYASAGYIPFPSYGYGYVRPSWSGYSSWNCRPYCWPSLSVGFRSSCYPRYGLSVGFGGYRGGWGHGGGGWRHCR